MDKIMQYLGDESGASAAEYALILALIALVIIVSVTTLGKNINTIFSAAAVSI
jgi:pilus assembly protein Flp/PilA